MANDDNAGGKGKQTLLQELEDLKREQLIKMITDNSEADEKRQAELDKLKVRVDTLERNEIRTKATSYAGGAGGIGAAFVALYEILQAMGQL